MFAKHYARRRGDALVTGIGLGLLALVVGVIVLYMLQVRRMETAALQARGAIVQQKAQAAQRQTIVLPETAPEEDTDLQ